MKTCEYCGESYAKRPKEAYWQFDECKFCSSACANRGRRTTRVPDSEFKARYRQKKLPGGKVTMEHRWVMEQAAKAIRVLAGVAADSLGSEVAA